MPKFQHLRSPDPAARGTGDIIIYIVGINEEFQEFWGECWNLRKSSPLKANANEYIYLHYIISSSGNQGLFPPGSPGGATATISRIIIGLGVVGSLARGLTDMTIMPLFSSEKEIFCSNRGELSTHLVVY